jgi:protein-disulfide isomerase
MTDKKNKKADQLASRRQQRKMAQQQAEQRKKVMRIGAIALAAILIAGIVILLARPEPDRFGPVKAVAAPDPSIPQQGLFIGDPNAPLTIIEYGDYQCPWCEKFNTEGFPPMLEEYIKTGQVRFEFRPFSFLGRESTQAARAAFCADEQGQFWAMHELIYGNHDGENQGAYADKRLREMAVLAGLDMGAYDSCMDSQRSLDKVEAANKVARDNGISSTPTIIIGDGEPTGWSQAGWPEFKKEIDDALANL